jgi:hypothetical protein
VGRERCSIEIQLRRTREPSVPVEVNIRIVSKDVTALDVVIALRLQLVRHLLKVVNVECNVVRSFESALLPITCQPVSDN